MHDRLARLRDTLLQDLIERGVAVRLALLAMLAGEHVLLVGPPGTAKSLVARRLRLALADAAYFERLLTRFTVPEELFGPLSILGLEEDRYERLTDGYLPSASVAFLDEIFKANSAILNALLTLLNERAFDNGTRRADVPLAAVVGASNELPEGVELDALFDRFLLRLHVGPVSPEGFEELLGLRGEAAPELPAALRLSQADLELVRTSAADVDIPSSVLALLSALRQWCLAEKIFVSDRRWRKVVKLLQVSALTNGRGSVSVWDCWLLQYCLWSQTEEREKIYQWYEQRVGASSAMDPSKLTKVVVHWEQRLESDRASRTQVRDEEGRPLYGKSAAASTSPTFTRPKTDEEGRALFLAPTNSAVNRGGYRGSYEKCKDRSKGGEGFTVEELDPMAIDYNGDYHPEIFQLWESRDSYLADTNNRLMEELELPALLEPTRHKPEYINACRGQIESLNVDISRYREGLLDHIASMEAEISSHLWVCPEFAGPARRSLDRTLVEVDGLLSRVDRLLNGFDTLPMDPVEADDSVSGLLTMTGRMEVGSDGPG